MTEPDNWLIKPLNKKATEVLECAPIEDDNEVSSSGESSSKAGKFEEFVEDPAAVRARMEQRRETKYQNQHQHKNQPPPRDVVGKFQNKNNWLSFQGYYLIIHQTYINQNLLFR